MTTARSAIAPPGAPGYYHVVTRCVRRSFLCGFEFMKYLSQPIARRANIEDKCTGKFWEGRFKCQRLLDEAAVLSAMVYVDLNPIRAAMAQDLEDSDYTSIQHRIRETALKLGGGSNQLEAVAGVPGTGSLPISIAQYLNLVDWTGRQMHPGKRGKACPRLDRGSIPSGPGSLIDSASPTAVGPPRSSPPRTTSTEPSARPMR